MEENSEHHVGTDVSSTTSAVPDTQQATGIHGNLETVIVVEEVKEEDLNSYGTPESSPTKSKDAPEAVATSIPSPEKDQSKKIVISSNKEVRIVYFNKQRAPTKSAEVNCTLTESEQDQKIPTLSGHMQKSLLKLDQAQKIPIKLVQVQKTPKKFEYMQKTLNMSESVQKTPPISEQIQEQLQKKLVESNQMPKTSLIVEQVPKKLDLVQKMQIDSECPKKLGQITSPPKSDQMPKSQPESDQVPNSPPKSDQVPKSPPKPEQVTKSPPKSGQVPKSPPKLDQVPQSPPKLDQVSKTDQVPKSHPNLDQVPKSPPKSDQEPESPPKAVQVPKSSPKSVEMPKTLPKSGQMIKTPSEQVQKKLDQVLETPKNSDQIQNTSTKSEQVQTTMSVYKKVDEAEKIVGQKTPIKSSVKSLEQQKSKDIIDISDDEVIDHKEMPESVSKPTKESNQIKELAKEQEQSKETSGKHDLNKSDSHTNKSEKSSIKDKSPKKESLDKQNSSMDCSDNAELIKDSTDKVKGNKKDEKKEDGVSPTAIDICEKSNDSQSEMNSDISEKDHNKSISRELKSLLRSAKDSKIISECTQLTSKTRKSRAATDSNNTSLNASVEADKIQNVRRSSINSQKSNCSGKSEKATKRSMRSQNPEFVNKVKQFLNSVTGKNQKGDDEEEVDNRKKDSESSSPSPKKKKLTESQQPEVTEEQNRRLRSDLYCWRCHWAVEQAANDKGHPPLQCTVCPRTFHYKCLTGTERNRTMTVKGWICTECMNVLHAESSETQSLAMKKLNHPRLCELLQYAWDRMVDLNGVEPFMNPVDRTAFPDYDKYVVHPMDLSLMKKNLSQLKYGSTEAFLADAQWILHNSIIFNTLQSKLTAGARALVRSCRSEMGEIEACPECYAAAHARRLTWFTDVCSTPHILLWAKLKGFPYWPAKGMSVNSQGLVDVRFFGAHDRAWVPARDCFLYCQKDPNNFKAKRMDILESMQEAEDHIRNISRKYGKFVYPAFKTPFDPTKLTEQLKMMIPAFDGELSALVKEKPATSSPNVVKDRRKSRSNSKSSKNSAIEGDASENDEAKTPRKMADGTAIAREKDDVSIEKSTPMEIDDQSVQNKEKDSARKRRRSGLEEAVITIINTSSSDKRKKIENEKVKDDKKAESTQENSKKPEGTTTSETTTSNNNKNEKTVEKANNKVNEVKLPTTPTVNKEVDKEVPTKKVEKTQAVTSTPVKTTPKVKPIKTSTPKEKEEKKTTAKQKTIKPDKPSQIEKEKQDESILKSRRRSKSRNRSLNSSQVEKEENTAEKKSDKDTVSNDSTNDKIKETTIPSKDKATEAEKPIEKVNKPNTNVTDNSKSVKDRLQFDDDTSLAVIARESAKKSFTGLPTISSVRSLSTSAQSTSTITKTTTTPKTVEVTVSAHCALNVFTPTSTDNVRNMKEAVDKLQKLRNETDKPLVGRVGVRSFARMTSPPAPPANPADTVEIEVKSEPIDFDDAYRQVEKMDLMRSLTLQPVNTATSASLRDVRINKVVVAPLNRKGVTKTTEVRIRARKTFPTPRKDANDGRSELNGKNTMVYIPIQPPTTQAPTQRPPRPITINGVNSQTIRPQAQTSIVSVVNTQTTPLVSVPMTTSLAIATPKPTNTIATNSHNNAICVPSVGQMPTIGQVCQVPTVGQIPTTVHTVPLITSVNGQWTFSLQPMMSVGGDGTASPPVVNGLPERNKPFIPMAPPNPLALLPSTQILPNNNNASSNNGDTTTAELPRLQQRPPLVNPFDPSALPTILPAPSTAGPLTAKLNRNAVKLADFFRTMLEDSLEKIDDPSSQATILRTQLEQVLWKHQQEIKELKHTHELLTTEMRVAFEKEKTRAISEMRRVAQVELEAAVKAAKTKQWCANCNQEAQFYCCWNTSYCDYPCQRSHWSQHSSVCTQQRNTENNSNENGGSLDKRLQSAPENLPVLQRNPAAPPLAVGTKLTPTRVYAQDAHAQKTSIIVSMVEDPSGNQMVKCVGTYKPTGTQQVSPLILNKQLISNDENAAKKVMTSGGYLIVGAGNSTPLTTNRRTHPVQYTYNT
ncbi:MYND-type zinc finger-containing chromatin reader ZMYND8-like isoform X2 [Maniola hyperantus]|uniref:MYND-type zinc finger-containing chromatin reader ZMYND8-like isoform X2 n=2 Tax=Aphantopus hyperantus TaxID=2795564 RepID=UPI00374865E0